jgi:hypothetical protein
MIVPCAQYGALTAEDLEAMGRLGRDIRPELSRMIGWQLTRDLLWYLSDWWDTPPNERWAHIGNVRETHGNMSVCRWFRAEELFAEAVAKLEDLWDELDGGSLDVWDLDSRDRFKQTMESLGPLTSTYKRFNTRHALSFHSSWLILKLRAKEMRARGTDANLGEMVRETFDDAWLNVRRDDSGGWAVFMADGDSRVVRVPALRYGLTPR